MRNWWIFYNRNQAPSVGLSTFVLAAEYYNDAIAVAQDLSKRNNFTLIGVAPDIDDELLVKSSIVEAVPSKGAYETGRSESRR